MFSKSLETALAAMACLAEAYDEGASLTAAQIAVDRELNQPFLAKQLTALSQGGLVLSKPGRNGGFALARPPGEITLMQIAESVGYCTRIRCCPFGPQHGEGNPCPLHDRFCALRDQTNDLLKSSTLAGFGVQRQAVARTGC